MPAPDKDLNILIIIFLINFDNNRLAKVALLCKMAKTLQDIFLSYNVFVIIAFIYIV